MPAGVSWHIRISWLRANLWREISSISDHSARSMIPPFLFSILSSWGVSVNRIPCVNFLWVASVANPNMVMSSRPEIDNGKGASGLFVNDMAIRIAAPIVAKMTHMISSKTSRVGDEGMIRIP